MSTATIDPSARQIPRFGGLSLTVARIEIRRMLRNKRAMIFTLVMPVILFVIISSNTHYENTAAGSGNISAVVLINMAAYGAILAATSGGAVVATERALGWSRQLRLTPLSPIAYIAIKAFIAMLLGLVSVLAVNVAGLIIGSGHMPTHVWIEAAVMSWLGSAVFGAFGLFVGYLLPSENVMQVLGPVMALLAMIGGLWFPITKGSTLDHISSATPVYGLAHVAQWPLYGGSPEISWFINLVGWFAVFVAGAAWRMSKDTARV